jgi:hypothetical protein
MIVDPVVYDYLESQAGVGGALATDVVKIQNVLGGDPPDTLHDQHDHAQIKRAVVRGDPFRFVFEKDQVALKVATLGVVLFEDYVQEMKWERGA